MVPTKYMSKAPLIVMKISSDWCEKLQESPPEGIEEAEQEGKMNKDKKGNTDDELDFANSEDPKRRGTELNVEQIVSREVKRALKEQQEELMINIRQTITEELSKRPAVTE
jgi:hypothetical protein